MKITVDRELKEGVCVAVCESGAWFYGVPPKSKADMEVIEQMLAYNRQTMVEMRFSPADDKSYFECIDNSLSLEYD